MENAYNIDLVSNYACTRLADLKRRLNGLDVLRDQVKTFQPTYTQAINSYTFEFNAPILETMVAIAQGCPKFVSPLVTAFSNFIQWKDRIGRERALGSRGFFTYAYRNPEFCDRMISLMAEQETYLNSFMAVASPRQISIVQNIVTSKRMQSVEEVRDLLKANSPTAKIEEYSGEQWFTMTTEVIDELREAEIELVKGLYGPEGEADFSPKLLSEHDEKSSLFPYLRSLTLFSTLSDQELMELSGFATVKTYNKGKLLFLQGEPASRIYIVISGWVKVYNGLETGEETILQMLTGGDTLLEAAVFLNTSAPVNAQIVEDAVLMSIPAPVIRQRVQSNNKLALSMLNNVSLKSQMLIYQIEQNRLKSARERVGWFLLRLMINQDPDDGVIHLPYDKSIIASYLNMRPETFSRALKKMRAEGFEVQNETITIPKGKTLCEFCDSYVANDCKRAGQPDCPHPDFVEIDLL
ncbi:hypothetical protein GCM10017044_15420 [Kordiimonas sediminis]|uniref:Crp/Fnr family transcriptional regulator n=2 Tax=Kordiimonas sediminis TaxID=1735581 RepID=A0A919AQL4_9PROT|nr:hypothetical protein GCM10017044_15420 [Kordiimonas sediminis]